MWRVTAAVTTKIGLRCAVAMLVLAVLCCASPAGAQSDADSQLQRGSHEMQAFLSESHAVRLFSRGVRGEIVQVGGRYGLLLTDSHLRGPLRGQFEYAVDFIPIIVPFQSSGVSYGLGLDPFVLKWNFQQRGHLIPYMEADAGGIATTARVPPPGSHWNFTASAAVGLQIVRGRNIWSVDCRYYHISDAYIISGDPTFNTIQVRIGFARFRHPRS
jgi:hypothetical protein